MTDEQFDRWKEFSLRMAKTCYANSRRPSGEWVLSWVEDVFDRIESADYIPDIIRWDDSRGNATLVCDHVSEMMGGDWPGYRPCRACRFQDHPGDCRCDEIEVIAGEQWEEQWAGPVNCCVRAGLDLAAEPSAGVIGFSVGDLRRMYPDGLPDWVQDYFLEPIGADIEDRVPVWL